MVQQVASPYVDVDERRRAYDDFYDTEDARPKRTAAWKAPMTLRMNLERLDWQNDGLCAQTDAEVFFPDGGARGDREAKRACSMCDVRSQCLDYAIEWGVKDPSNPPEGIWGGTSKEERGPILTELLRRSSVLIPA